jgi:uncharacterized membrane protein YqgA involved in biofilm formation
MSSFVAAYLRQWHCCTAVKESLNKALSEDMAVMEKKKGLDHQFVLVLSSCTRWSTKTEGEVLIIFRAT